MIIKIYGKRFLKLLKNTDILRFSLGTRKINPKINNIRLINPKIISQDIYFTNLESKF